MKGGNFDLNSESIQQKLGFSYIRRVSKAWGRWRLQHSCIRKSSSNRITSFPDRNIHTACKVKKVQRLEIWTSRRFFLWHSKPLIQMFFLASVQKPEIAMKVFLTPSSRRIVLHSSLNSMGPRPGGPWTAVYGNDPCVERVLLGGGFKDFIFSSQTLRKWSNLTDISQMDWNHQLAMRWHWENSDNSQRIHLLAAFLYSLERLLLFTVPSHTTCCLAPTRAPTLTWPMAKLSTFWDFTFSSKNKVQTFISGSIGWVRIIEFPILSTLIFGHECHLKTVSECPAIHKIPEFLPSHDAGTGVLRKAGEER